MAYQLGEAEHTESGANGAIRFAIFAGLGSAVGALVALIEWAAIEVALHALVELPVWVQAGAPAIGLAGVAVLYRLMAAAPSSSVVPEKLDKTTTDAYITAFHDGEGPDGRQTLPKVLSSLLTLGTGGALGLEGTSVLMGSSLGKTTSTRFGQLFGRHGHRVLVAAGAAAGVAAVFKAPATGLIFALEVPYRRDIARHALIPALISSAAAYVTFGFLAGSEALLEFAPAKVSLTDELIAAVTLGLVGGAIARGLAAFFHWAKHLDERIGIMARVAMAGTSIAVSIAIASAITDLPILLGPGAEVAALVVNDIGFSIWALLGLFALRAIVTASALGAGGVGGLFIPLVVQGLLLGRVVELVFDAPQSGLYPVVGLAAVLGAGYRTPLAAVMFVAESTGRAEFVIPALIATAISQSLMGERSVSDSQLGERQGQLETRLGAPAMSVMVGGVGHVGPETSLLDVIDEHGIQPASPALPIAGDCYVGLLVLHDIATTMLEHGPEATAVQTMRDVPAIHMNESAIHAARIMNDYDTAAVAVVDDHNMPVGVISALSLAGLGDLSDLD